jgi:RND family efflux transporter MFP subunit
MPDSLPPDPTSLIEGSMLRRYGRIALILALALAVFGVGSRVLTRRHLADETLAHAVPNVVTVHPILAPGGESLVLPGTVQAFYEAPIYARTSGYLKSWSTDIGARVKKGQVLAAIDTPEVDQQFLQAQADAATAAANYEIARVTNERWKGLLATESVSKQDADQKASDAAAKKAALDSAKANLARLRELESFKNVVAPFDGVVTQRNTDIGNLINSGQGATTPLFRVADTHKLRIYVAVPEPYAPLMKPGVATELVFSGHRGKAYPADITSTAQALDPVAKTLQVELQLDNAAGELLPGAYAEVHFTFAPTAGAPRVPVTALLFRGTGLHVATVGEDHRVTLKKIVTGRDYGTEIEVLSGVTKDDAVVANPPDSLADGAEVHVLPPAPPAQAGKDRK